MSKAVVFEYYPDTSIIKLHLPSGDEREIEINPGWSFGKGNHPTTKLCIKALENLFKNEQIESVLDVGCGSGVLSISAAALGAKQITAVDIDNIIILEADSNIEKNGFLSITEIILGSVEDVAGVFDLVVSNILIRSILAISEELKKRVKYRGTILLSGIKNEEKTQAINKFSDLGFYLQEEFEEREWVALVLKNSTNDSE